jgi:hypothetical protein
MILQTSSFFSAAVKCSVSNITTSKRKGAIKVHKDLTMLPLRERERERERERNDADNRKHSSLDSPQMETTEIVRLESFFRHKDPRLESRERER